MKVRVLFASLLCVCLSSSPGFAQAPGEPPRVKIVSPAANDPIEFPLQVRALVQARSAEIDAVSATVNDRELGELTAPPYSWTVSGGNGVPLLEVRVRARDVEGNVGEAEVLLTGTGNQPAFRSDTDAVALTLLATDRRGQLVHDLQPSEITIRDNRRPVELLEMTIVDAPVRAVVLLDRSHSMSGKLDIARRSLDVFLDLLGDEDEVQLVAFNHRVATLADFTTDHDRIREAAATLTAQGGTALHDAILLALREFASGHRVRTRPAAFVFSDGRDQHSVNTLSAVIRGVRLAGVTVFAVGQGEALEDDDLKDGLEEMADATGGTALFEEDPRRLPALFERIGRQMRSMYFLSFTPADLRPGTHRVSIETTRERLRLRYRREYER